MSNEEAEEMWLKLKDMKRIPSDGIFYCRNVDGRKVVVLYNEAMGICMTCDTDDCDLGKPENFEERH
jgi:hypothetical protein